VSKPAFLGKVIKKIDTSRMREAPAAMMTILQGVFSMAAILTYY